MDIGCGTRMCSVTYLNEGRAGPWDVGIAGAEVPAANPSTKGIQDA
jgi:hypothetical protein